MRIRRQDGADIELPSKGRFSSVEIAVKNERCHSCAVSSLGGWILSLDVIRIIDNQSSRKTLMILNGEPIEKSYYGLIQNYPWWCRLFVGDPSALAHNAQPSVQMHGKIGSVRTAPGRRHGQSLPIAATPKQ